MGETGVGGKTGWDCLERLRGGVTGPEVADGSGGIGGGEVDLGTTNECRSGDTGDWGSQAKPDSCLLPRTGVASCSPVIVSRRSNGGAEGAGSSEGGSMSIHDRLLGWRVTPASPASPALEELVPLPTVELRLRVFGVMGAQSRSNSAFRDDFTGSEGT